ncbi:MAG: TolC family protein, partial [Kiritimatiellia bacterium]|nr:TolC family protein [Kiritimatiellia bacterium]
MILSRLRIGILAAVPALVAVCCMAESEPASPLTLDDCIRIGLERNTSLSNVLIDEQIAETRIRQIRAQILPHVTARGGLTRIDEVETFEFNGLSFAAGRETSYSAAAEISQLLYAGGSVEAALNAATSYRELSRARIAQRAAELIRDIKTAYYGLLLAREEVRIRESSVAQWADFLAQTEERFRRDSASEFDRLNARVRLANERPKLTHARKNLELARGAFQNLLRLNHPDFELEPVPDHPHSVPDLNTLIRTGLQNRPELLQLAQRTRLQRAEIRSEQGGYFPEVRLTAAYSGLNPPGFGSSEDSW